MGIEKTRLLACSPSIRSNECRHESQLKIYQHVLLSSQHDQRTKNVTQIPWRLWESKVVDIFSINNRNYLYIVDYHNKLCLAKPVESFSAVNLIKICKIMFLQYGLPSNIVPDAGKNFISKKFENFCKKLSPPHVISSYNHQSNGQAKACIKLSK